ncbi:histone deacetylase family protein [Fadolivirus algeromassiliense]|jgi:acetoin utilization deacetylase AcuC-like enzyme|uniref:Histone deacetylase family protein n=1 Tax=Fadolivirus FV1/VV64 TaxID=3070911 RepID=A0A7D3V586_9VIRU|nr:histone deacetylase family protein [Fadolivirus algeromassiliense]QKF93675.1 histone deacetylase family protein [Fadolivirus FV1/VV64]
MLTVLTNIVRPHHERSGTGSKNKPELRQKLIIDAIQKNFSECQIIFSSKMITDSWLENIHDKDYIDFLENAFTEWQKIEDPDWIDVTNGLVPNHFYKKKPHRDTPLYKFSGFYGTDCMTPIYKDTYQNAMIAAQQAYKAAEIVCNSDSSNIVYVLACSPGHHAKYAEYGGYCFINNASVSAYRLIELGKKKVGILDLDYHQGTSDLVLNNPKFKDKIVICSIHADPSVDYPSFEGYEDECVTDSVLNIPLIANAAWEDYKDALETACETIKKWNIDALIIPFGADTYKEDPDASPLGRFQLDLEDYDNMAQTIRKHFNNISIIVTQEGGYNMDKVSEILCRFLKNLIPGL